MSKLVKIAMVIKLERVNYCKGCPGLKLSSEGLSRNCTCEYGPDSIDRSCSCEVEKNPLKNKYECAYLKEKLPIFGDPLRLKKCLEISKKLKEDSL
jgi:hypothetical protein